ncbi:hypothetical protein Rsub_10183 [Raphidocelis subcapitata]|uniref:Uncharacterized protein n=1 Tax=Raphidocelis subcapitata TaxID=307507 RepID=A0A2V0PD26_9CHLO|nr:hypothetical protein Rsub_10183 [Raphidocelis subcapitata]|eukprot:GBF97758.1 hypothetical protein Rsub_10183 [Raphidocelis subcapitata]
MTTLATGRQACSRAPCRAPPPAKALHGRPRAVVPRAGGRDEPGAEGAPRNAGDAAFGTDTLDEEVAASVGGYDEEEPGLTPAIRAAIRSMPGDVRGGLRPRGASPPPPPPLASEAAPAPSSAVSPPGRRDEAGGGGGAGYEPATGGAAGLDKLADQITVEEGGVQMVTGADAAGGGPPPAAMSELARDALRQGLAED